MALWAASRPLDPIEGEIRRSKPSVLLALPTVIGTDWPQNIDLVQGLAGHEVVRGNVAGIHNLLGRGKTSLGQGGLDTGSHGEIRRGRWSGLHIGNEMRTLFVTGFRQVDFVSGPDRAAFLAVARLTVIRSRN